MIVGKLQVLALSRPFSGARSSAPVMSGSGGILLVQHATTSWIDEVGLA